MDVEGKNTAEREVAMMLLQRRGRSDFTWFREKKSCQHVASVMDEDCTSTVER